MKRVEYEQGTSEWKNWRADKIGASDSAIILSLSPYKTAYELWLEKTGRRCQKEMNSAMKFGHDNEESCRQWIENYLKDFYPPVCVEHPENNWMIASLDGYSETSKIILEAKCCNEKIFKQTQEGEIPEHFKTQGYHQLECVPEAEKVAFVFKHKENFALLYLERDELRQEDITKKIHEFYHHNIFCDNPPELSQKDYVDMSDNEEWGEKAERIVELYPQIQDLKKEFEKLKKEIVDLTDDGNASGNCVKITRSYRKGSIDYAKMAQDGINIEKYRKSNVYTVTMSIEK